ncbi:hypothetical protein [Enterococcus faecium]|uniref:lipopolysaccharide biosynthesis protein n=1 Tax=Enterococcus faecium TaxID=1352 RepID=UPI00296AD8DF|nr:hypothetical protein [Enterococcus faecium]MDW3718630.1 hypothetical protein [Enterococcus faecium]
MNLRLKKFVTNMSYSLSSNILALLVSSLVILVVPKLLGVKEYGYWQLYLFYTSYVGFTHLGWSDGIYLRLGGEKYDDLDKNKLYSQFWMLGFSQLILGFVLLICITFVNKVSMDKVFIFEMTVLCMIVSNIRIVLLHILQATNRIKEYAVITIIDRLAYFLLIVVFLIFGVRNYKFMIFADIVGKSLSLLISIYTCKDLVLQNIRNFSLNIKEALYNISIGMKLMLANIASILIIGIVRFSIERQWDVSTFGKVSLTLSISNLVMVFINAIGLIMFPFLRTLRRETLPKFYKLLRSSLILVLLILLLFYYPFRAILEVWLPQYAESLKYMALVFPISLYEGKMALLINTYLKTLRLERLILLSNMLTVVLSGVVTVITVFVLKSLTLAVLSIVALLAFRSIFAELQLVKYLKIDVYKDILYESMMVCSFIISGWFCTGVSAFMIYLICFAFYLFVKRNDINRVFKESKKLLEKRN